MRKLTIAARATAPPGMPTGAPGLAGASSEPFIVVAVGDDRLSVLAVEQGRT